MLRFSKYLFVFIILLISSICVQAQISAETRDGRTRTEELPSNIKETLAKHRIDQDKKDHDELMQRGQQALKLSEQIENSYKKNNKLLKTDLDRLDLLEKLLKKIRKELGGDDDDGNKEDEKPTDIGEAVEFLRENTVLLFDHLQKTTRYSISAVAIQSSNSVLKIVKMMRFWKN